MPTDDVLKKSLEKRRENAEKKKKKFLKLLEEGRGIVVYACKKLGIDRSTFYNWKNNDEEFAKQCEHITEENVDMAESKLLNAINEENLTAIIFYLKTKGKKRGYIESAEQNLNVSSFEQLMRDLPDNPDEKK